MATTPETDGDVAAGTADPDGAGEGDGTEGRTRKRGVLATLPFLAIGIADVILLLEVGLEPLWGFAILPPILFCSVLAYLVFSTDFLEDRT
ncbi:hypothetical protein [Halorarum halobium]|uniref:hypothetical protein n=1 Tax=Halorarum halobium TaxID=3075121 RepID=UPI0028AABAAE|nr:hypothetical protein [Halobaculum sp. XH14]